MEVAQKIVHDQVDIGLAQADSPFVRDGEAPGIQGANDPACSAEFSLARGVAESGQGPVGQGKPGEACRGG